MIFELVYFRHCASINSNCALPFPRANSLEFAFFLLWMANSGGPGQLSSYMAHGGDDLAISEFEIQ